MIIRSLGGILLTRKAARLCVVPQRTHKVLIIGGSSALGQNLALLLKLNSQISDLNIYDDSAEIPGIVMDLNHISRCPKVWGIRESKYLAEAVKGSNIIIIAGSMMSKAFLSEEQLFCTNAEMICKTVHKIAQHAPHAITLVAATPVNSLVPMAATIMKKVGNYCSNKLFGVTTLNVMRVQTIIADICWMDPSEVNVTVIGGNEGATIIPVLSQSSVELKLPYSRLRELTKKIQSTGLEVVKAKSGRGGAVLSTAYAVARFTDAVLKGLSGKDNIVECAYVESCITDATFFANPVKLGKNGLEKNCGCGKLSDYEAEQLRDVVPIIQQHIETGVKYGTKYGNTITTNS